MTTSAAIRVPARQFDNALLSAPILPTLLRLTAPNLAAMLVVALVAICETAYVGMLGTTPLAAIALVFPLVMLTQMLSACDAR
jgi:Na+-driven multidrug efflux pump